MRKKKIVVELYEVRVELGSLCSLLTVLIERIDGLAEQADVSAAAAIAADVARVASDYLSGISVRIERLAA